MGTVCIATQQRDGKAKEEVFTAIFKKKVKELTLLVDTTLIICRASVDPCTLYAYLMKNIYNSYEQTLITCAPAYIQDKSKFVLMNRTHSFSLLIASNCFLMFQI